MAKYDLYKTLGFQGYLLDIQCDLLEGLNTRVVVPLMSLKSAPIPAEKLNPIFTIKNKQFVMVTQYLSSVPISILKTPVGNIDSHHDEIVSAVDMLIHGF